MLHLGLSVAPTDCVAGPAGEGLERIIPFVQDADDGGPPAASGVELVRLRGVDFERDGQLSRLLDGTRAGSPSGLLIDLAELSDLVAVNERVIRGVIARAAARGPWAFIAVAGCSMTPERVVPRSIWVAVRAAARGLAAHVIAVESWPAAVGAATFAYTERHAWRRFSTRGTCVAARRELALRVVEYGGFEGESFSDGVRWLAAAAEGEVDVMDARAWRGAELSHHVAAVSRDLDAVGTTFDDLLGATRQWAQSPTSGAGASTGASSLTQGRLRSSNRR